LDSACKEARSFIKIVNHNTGITRYLDDMDLQELQRIGQVSVPEEMDLCKEIYLCLAFSLALLS